ncbi:MAG TPA: hypothetical protein LFW20_07740 [Rickettsia endosymbiont of Omalisus fontisbellaquei]|nr:hypothetical protein [Rickettsia endosymbiont of Omalisus fontisbellaquei]
MKLKEYFEKLESTAFGPWLAAFKELFSKEELEEETLNIKQKESEKLEVNKKDLVVLSNNVIEIEGKEIIEQEISRVNQYKENIGLVFTLITNIQLEKFAEFISNLPKKHSEFKDYFCSEEQKDGFFKEDAYKKVVNKGKLVEKFQNSDKYNYEKIEQNVYELQAYLGSYEYNCGIPKSDLLGQAYYS